MKLVPKIDITKDFGQTHVGLTPRVVDINENCEEETTVPSKVVERLKRKLPDANSKGVKLS